ncbi:MULTISPECIES: FAD-dependent oxidoreductase [unclassified Bradyrhizobium]|uniref:FAD-dependent oxidoreductase n=1 Tax=unclassified Bradyrhizobium TaxID=2631580 RepID=UPI00339B55E7
MNQMTVAVLGLRAMGSAAAATLARRGCRVIGFEQYWRAHNRGASHGDTRAIRKAYVREEQYAPLVLDSYELCRRPEKDSGAELLRDIGGLVVAAAGERTLSSSIATATRYGISHEVLDRQR